MRPGAVIGDVHGGNGRRAVEYLIRIFKDTGLTDPYDSNHGLELADPGHPEARFAFPDNLPPAPPADAGPAGLQPDDAEADASAEADRAVRGGGHRAGIAGHDRGPGWRGG